ncbi:PREDICTED: uncharacterized protein LOC109161584 isoform X2 [Ipomoea nil]|uniref:uncharacterized protein LOC109161584 isoform X2 n=1 Tax=Ipomoea nil TaxID=35883 RepID=UPI000900AC1F|nr:PREDICTED: uncharacterized protein LOC109161584 isoform X2 [Ipomoea nil]
MRRRIMGNGEAMASKEVLLKVLLDELVDPHLPVCIPSGTPPIDKQRSVAKQLHCIVLLYNYYHRKQYPQAEYLDFKSFCELVVTLKPVLAWHMNCKKSQSDSVELNDSENQFSITEKAIQGACNLSSMLDASKANPVMEGWEISKVSVLLLDSKKENCFLRFGSVNDGVWSVLEKDLENSTSERKHMNKRRRIGMKSLPSEPKTNDSSLQQLAFLAVQDATGIRRSDLKVLEKRVVYSLSKAKTTACFYIIQCSQSASQDFQIPIKDAIKSLQGPLVENSSGCWFTTPVVEYFHLLPYATILSDWILRDTSPSSLHSSISRSPKDAETTSVSELSGNEIASSKMGDTSIKTLGCLENHCNNIVSEINENSDRSTNSAKSSGNEVGNEIASLRMGDTSIKTLVRVSEINENSDRSTNSAKSSGKEVGNEIASLDMGDTSIKILDCLDNHCNNVVSETNENSDRSANAAKSCGKEVGASASSQRIGKKKTVDERESFNNNHCNSNFISKDTSSLNQEVREAFKYKSIDGDCESISECAEFRVEEAKAIKDIVKEVADFNNSYKSSHGTSFTGNELDNASVASQELEKIYHGQTKDTTDFGANETELACKVIFSASDGKSSTQTVPGRLYKNEEILCTKHRHIQDKKASCDKSIHGILDGRKDNEGLEGKVIKQLCDEICFKRTHTQEVQKLGSVALSLRPACQDLDVICRANNWRLPTYIISGTHGGFRIKVVMQEGSFKCSCEGDMHSDSLEAKESAAAKMVSRLRAMADQIHQSLS